MVSSQKQSQANGCPSSAKLRLNGLTSSGQKDTAIRGSCAYAGVEVIPMKALVGLGAAVLFLSLGTTVPAFAQQGQGGAKPEQKQQQQHAQPPQQQHAQPQQHAQQQPKPQQQQHAQPQQHAQQQPKPQQQQHAQPQQHAQQQPK